MRAHVCFGIDIDIDIDIGLDHSFCNLSCNHFQNTHTSGYNNLPEKTAEAIDKNGYFHSGDVGKMENGFVYILDRLKDLIIRGGEVRESIVFLFFFFCVCVFSRLRYRLWLLLSLLLSLSLLLLLLLLLLLSLSLWLWLWHWLWLWLWL